MERVQGPLPKQASTSHLFSSFSSPSELCPQFPPPLHPSSQALFWNNSSNARHDLIHQASPWSPHCTHPHISPHADISNVLQLKHGAAINKAAHDGIAANNATPSSVVEIDALVTPSDNAVGPALLLDTCCVDTEKSQSFTHSVVSAPFYCKPDMAATKSRNTLLASLSAHIAEDIDKFPETEDNGPASISMLDNPICGFEGNGQSRTEQSSIEKGRYEWKEKQMKIDVQKQREEAGGALVHSLGDVAIGLKLGKRTYFGDLGVGGTVEASKQVSNCGTCNSNAGSIASNGNGGSAKKCKSSSPAANVPRCQAEDCKIDLTGAKEYHRRHKVCEWHSKSSKVKVANLDQRFCQQCSRFHVLTEFDEGKRSCRRRLAGHNERRRKQQPEPFPLLSAASYAYFAGAKHLFIPSLLDRSHFFEHEHVGVDFKDLQKPKIEPVENYQPLELHHFMQASQRGDEHLLLGGSAQALVLARGNGTNFGSPPAPLMTLTTCLVPDHHPQPSPETLVSGRALSLLSSSLGFPNTSNSVSTALGVSSPSFERRILENHQGTSSHQIVSGSSSCFTSNALKPVETLPLSHDNNINTLSGSECDAVSRCLRMNQVQPSTVLSFGGSSTFPINHGNDGQSGAARPMLDLMQVPFARSGTPRHQVEHQFTDLEGLSIFGRQSLM